MRPSFFPLPPSGASTRRSDASRRGGRLDSIRVVVGLGALLAMAPVPLAGLSVGAPAVAPFPAAAPQAAWPGSPDPAQTGAAGEGRPTPQDPEPSSLALRLLPSVGWYLPSGLLYRSDFPPARARMGRAASVGLGLQATFRALPVALRLKVEHADWFDTRLVGTIPGDDFQQTLTFHHAVPTAVSFLVADVLLRPRQPVRGARPFAFLGAGAKRYAFGETDPPARLGFTEPMDGTGGVVRYGVGTELTARGWTVAPEVGGSFSRYVLVDDELGGRRSHPQREWMLAVRLHLPLAGVSP